MAKLEDCFKHDAHIKLLEEAERYLRAANRDDLAGAVSRASMLHTEFISRMATARREGVRLRKAINHIETIRQSIAVYVTQSRGPWVGCDLWTEGWPDTP